MKIDFKLLVFSLFLPFFAGFIGSYFTTPSIPTWYAGLSKPFFNPPNWIFAPVWTSLYFLMGISYYLVANTKIKKGKKVAKYLYFSQLFLNSLWSIVFFGFQNILLALFVIVILWGLILAIIFKFKEINQKASYLLVPYLLWVSFASILNFSILLLNK